MKTSARLLAAAFIAAAGSIFPLKAQNYMFDNPDNKPFFGVRAGVDISSAANGGAFYSNKPGFVAGAVYNIPVVMNLYFEPGLQLFYNVFGTMHLEPYSVYVSDTNGNPVLSDQFLYQVDGTIRNFGFRIPLNLGYHFDFSEDLSVHVFTGPQLNLSLVARYHQNEVITPDDKVVEPDSQSIFGTGGFKHADLQWNFGVGITWQRYYMSLGGSVGITHIKSASVVKAGPYTVDLNRNLRRNIFNISVGYNF